MIRKVVQKFDGFLWQSATPDKTATGECDEKFTPQKSSANTSHHLSSSDSRRSTKLSPGKGLQSSAAKRLQYTLTSESKSVTDNTSNGFKTETLDELKPSQALKPSQPVLPFQPCSLSHTANNESKCCLHDQNGTTEVSHTLAQFVTKSAEVTNKSPKVNRSPKVSKRSPEVNRSPRQSIKRASLESPAGQPKTKKFIVERLRNAKTSRKKTVDSKTSPVGKSPQHKYTGKSALYICSVLVKCFSCYC